MIVAWWKRRKQWQKEELHRRGYDWCAGELLRCGNEDHVDFLWDLAGDAFDPNEFEDGIKAALRDWEKLKATGGDK